ncbi:hypothetical protein GGC65_002449 [Sphingopyxis sp. OAS728]|uniref:NADP-dependent oxidoreductase n=1 Tax=Sphingopyxis sp. OAS728 TaxID=2663823 RepID=UPI00178AB1B0|nr:NADP-dependent oxidoreductase [Sphingopyxis sp. OAS728]MBE1527993.1 hypothetical protein [Sphingopyxis sp. OAS728]
MSRAWSLVRRPTGLPTAGNFELIDLPAVPLKEGEFRVRNTWLSVDPYMRARMEEIKYAPCFQIGEPMYGSAVGEVIETRNAAFKVGDRVYHSEGWREEAIVDPSLGAKEGVAPFVLPDLGVEEQVWLHNLGIPGGTGYFALFRTAGAKAGDIMFVSAAAGAVGSAVVQMGKARGMTVIGSAGGPEKCAFVKSLGADAVIDYKAGPVLESLREAAPEGIDVYFDNVAGDHLDAALACARPHARFAMCGMIGVYNENQPLELRNSRRIIQARIRLEGMYFGEFADELPVFYEDMGGMIARGEVRSVETVSEGIETMPEAFIGLFSGRNTGKMLVKL